MYFHTSEQHEAFRASVRNFAENEIKPIAAELDRENRFPSEIVEGMARLGLMGVPYPVEQGGGGLDAISYAIAVEELSRVDGGVGVILSAHVSLGCYPIYAYGTEAQKRKYLAPLARGEQLGAFGLTESDAGSDASGMETTAVLEGDHYVLNGSKIFITNAPKADVYIVFAVTQPEAGTRGISAFIVEKDWPGFTFGEHYDKMGIRSSATAELLFDNVKVPGENLLGQEGKGFSIAMATLDGGRIGIAAQALGIGQGAYESAVEYAKEREQFGKPVAFQQSISFKIADMATKLRASRQMVYSAADLKDKGEPYGMEAAMAKAYASERTLEIVNDAMQIYGGAGFMKGMDVERFYRDAKICTIYEGTNEIQRMVIASHILGREPRVEQKAAKKQPATGQRKRLLWKGEIVDSVAKLVEALKGDGYDFTVGIPVDTPISKADRVVSAGRGIGPKENMKLISNLAVGAGAAVGSSRPVAETLKYVPVNRYVGLSGQKFKGSLYIACGISGAGQHLKGIKDATTIVAINSNPNAKIFKNADYGIVGKLEDVLPLLTAALDDGTPKKEAPIGQKARKARPRKQPPFHRHYVCGGCGYEYNPDMGDEAGEIAPGVTFDKLPEDWICPECGEEKGQFVEM